MTGPRATRASFWRRRAGALGPQAQYPATVTYLEVGRFGELLIALEMDGEQLSLRLSPTDSKRAFDKLAEHAAR